jgi:hypothetical protein
MVPALPEDEKPPVARVLGAGAKGAERVAHATGVDRIVDQAVEEAIVRALRSPAVIRAIERAVERDVTNDQSRDEIAHVVKRILASDLADQAWKEVLESEQAQKLVERIAGAPEIRAAIASQGAGLMTDIGVRLTIITEELDDALERVVRPQDPDSETDQAGLATRSVAAVIDLGLLFAGYALIASVVSSLFTAVVGTRNTSVAYVADRGLDAARDLGRCDLRGLLDAGWANTRNAIPVDPPHRSGIAGDHIWSRATACLRRAPEPVPAWPRVPRDPARPLSARVARSLDRDRGGLRRRRADRAARGRRWLCPRAGATTTCAITPTKASGNGCKRSRGRGAAPTFRPESDGLARRDSRRPLAIGPPASASSGWADLASCETVDALRVET